MAASIFHLPDELVFTALFQSFPCREPQIKTLATLLYPSAAPCRNIVVHGSESTGKSAVTEAVLERMVEDGAELSYAIVNSAECITSRHLLEAAVARVAHALNCEQSARRCENLSQLSVELARMMGFEPNPRRRFVLVLDGVDHQRDAPPTLFPALARLSEIVPRLTTVFIMTCPAAGVLRTSDVPHVYFPNYTRNEFIEVLTATPPPPIPGLAIEVASDLWARFVGPVYDSLGKAAARTLPALQEVCTTLWPRFTAPILAGTHGPRELTRLLVAARVHLQDERILAPGLIAAQPAANAGDGSGSGQSDKTRAAVTATELQRASATGSEEQSTDLSSLLPTTARLVLVSAYLASHNATKHDLTLFSTHHHGRRRRRGGLTGGYGPRGKHRKIARRLLGAHAFVFERMLAIYVALRREWLAGSGRDIDDDHRGIGGGAMDCDVSMAVATLSSLRLLARVGGGDSTDRGGRWRVNVGWGLIRPLGRSMGLEVEDWLID